MQLCQEEIFGPVVSIQKFSEEKVLIPINILKSVKNQEAVDIANDCRTGLASYFYSGDVAQCWRVGNRLHELFSYLLYELEGKKTKLSNQSRRHFAQFTMIAP